MGPPTEGFQLKSASQSFQDKQKSVFDQLEVAEKNASNLLKNNRESDDYNQRNNRETDDYNQRNNHQRIKRIDKWETKHLQGRESIFKRPEAPINRCLPRGRMPDFRKNPHKWTKYTLEDVKDEDISDKGNTAAAMDFLKEISDRKNADAMEEDEDKDLPKRITFKKTALIKKKPENDDDEPKSSFKSSKVVMQEYVIGQKIKKDKKNKEKRAGNSSSTTSSSNNSNQLKLNHLFDDDDEEED